MEFVHEICAQIHLGFQVIPPFELFAIKILMYALRAYRLKDFVANDDDVKLIEEATSSVNKFVSIKR